ncbi:hypothetical protein [Nocardia jinanensis]|uniref:PH domain-containing protein n=1 Tax=Nocardia jinanensis TaxID=382504 RepID=A0A917VWQ5_9NOCA|nr:hypothetical protein [Nocardia jinanensis]GGL34719.1 hypothetical protein GCM10011588_56820 [Nocardia jinanensis]
MTRQPHTVSPDMPTMVAGPDAVADPRTTQVRNYFPPPRELRGNLNGWTYPAVFLVAVLATFLLAQAALALDSGEPLQPALHIAAAAWVVSYLPMLSATSRGRSRIRIEGARFANDQDALVVRRSLGYEVALVVCFISLATLCAIFGIGTWTGTLTVNPHPPIPPWLAVAVAVAVLVYLCVYARRPEIRRLVLTPMHIVLPTKTSVANMVSWTSIEQIAVVSRNNSKGTIRISRPGRKPGRSVAKRIHAEKLSIGSAATYWLIRFYHENPDLRVELTDERAAERLRTYAVVPEFGT